MDKNQREQEHNDLVKALKTFDFSDEEINEIISKGEDDPENKIKDKDGATNNKVEKSIEDIQSEIDGLEKSINLKKEELEALEGSGVDNNINKSEKDDLYKSLNEGLEANNQEIGELKKSVGDLTSVLEEIKKSVDLIGSQSQGRKSQEYHIIEKGEKVADDGGRRVLSVSVNKNEILKEMEDIVEKSEGVTREKYQDAIIGYNGGGAPISKSIAEDLFNNHKIRLVQ